MLKVGVLGAGHLGKIHLGLLNESEKFKIIGFHDPNTEAVNEVIDRMELHHYESAEELIQVSDVVDIVTPTLSHYDCAVQAIKQSKHVFIEKPVSNTLEEAKTIMSLAEEADVKVQVGHVERFNPAFIACAPYINQPMFIESHRLAEFNPRGTDVSVVLDLMIHDIDVILSVVKSNIKSISASGVAILSDTPDIANARIEFDNGCVANITANRFSLKNMRKSRFFQRDAYISVDFLEKKGEIVRMESLEGEPGPMDMVVELGKDKGSKVIQFESPEILPTNAIKQELESFADAIENNSTPKVTIEDGYNALDVAYKVLDKLKLTADYIS